MVHVLEGPLATDRPAAAHRTTKDCCWAATVNPCAPARRRTLREHHGTQRATWWMKIRKRVAQLVKTWMHEEAA